LAIAVNAPVTYGVVLITLTYVLVHNKTKKNSIILNQQPQVRLNQAAISTRGSKSSNRTTISVLKISSFLAVTNHKKNKTESTVSK
jgi:hypothetical protein